MKKRHPKNGHKAVEPSASVILSTASQMERAQATKTAPEAQFKRYRHLDVKLWSRNRQ